MTVADNRGALVNSWTTTGHLLGLRHRASTPDETVPLPTSPMRAGASTAHTGLGAFVPGTKIVAAPSYTGAAGNSSTTWNPTLTFTLGSLPGRRTYTGTVTHSVA